MSDINVQPIQWPSVTLAGGRVLTFRLAYSCYYQLGQWGKDIATASMLELAAAAAGSFDRGGNWKSAGFKSPIDLADIMEQSDDKAVSEAVIDALKKVMPGADLSVQAIPANEALA